MNSLRHLIVFAVALVLLSTATTASAFGIGDAVRKAKNEAEKPERKKRRKEKRLQEEAKQEKAGDEQGGTASEESSSKPAELTAAAPGKVIFSKVPIVPENPDGLESAFKAGDEIYALARFPKPIGEVFPKANEFMLLLQIDGKDVFHQYVQLKSDEAKKRDYLVIDIAPAIEKMVNYRDETYGWGSGYGGKRLGPHGFTWRLSQMAPGKHTLVLRNRHYGDAPVILGSFTIEGDDFKVYEGFHSKIEAAMSGVAKMPERKLVNAEMEAKMRKRLENAGWTKILHLRIVDKDWWLDRKSGGDSPIVSRHMDAAVASEDDQGACFYKICQFHEYTQIDGSFGPLQLTHQSDPRPLPRENIEK